MDTPLQPPLAVQQPERVARLPQSMPGGALYQAKLDGWRMLAFVDADGVTLQARSERIVTDRFPEILPALASLPTGTVLDGEAVAIRDGVFDFHALATPPKGRATSGVTVSFVAFDMLARHGEDIRHESLAERWAHLLAMLEGAPPQLQPVLATLDRAEAESWLEALADIGVEGVVAKDLGSPYRAGRGNGWVKIRHAETEDADLVGLAGPADRPTALRVRLPDGREAVTVNVDQRRLQQLFQAVSEAGGPVRVEVRVSGAGGSHERIEYVRMRPPEA
jgi:ATP-dependent DNA ligase